MEWKTVFRTFFKIYFFVLHKINTVNNDDKSFKEEFLLPHNDIQDYMTQRHEE